MSGVLRHIGVSQRWFDIDPFVEVSPFTKVALTDYARFQWFSNFSIL
jgi:hypothetical protein